MSPANAPLRRLAAAFSVEFGPSFRRPLFIVLALVLALTVYGLSSGHMQISSGDSSVGGTKAWITSEFAQTQAMTFLTLLYYAFFVAAAAGLSLLRDRETRVDVLLHSTPMTPGEYVWGRFLAIVASFVVLMLWQAGATAFFNHIVPNANATEIRGPFAAANYLLPLLTIGLPFLVFYGGVSMWVGERTRSAVMVFVVPVATLVACGFFLWTWSPAWLPWDVNRLLQAIEPSGYRWLNETYLKVDRGVEFYNHARVPYVGLFWLNRAWLLLLGLGALLATQRAVARSLRGDVAPARVATGRTGTSADPFVAAPPAPALAGLGMQGGVPSPWTSLRQVAVAELRELRRQAGLYIFVPLILIQSLGNVLFAVGAFDTPLLLTPGTTAVAIANQVSTFVCLLLLFYTVESLERERATGLAPILYATPMRLGTFLAGKAAANSVVAGVVLLAALTACWIALAIQRTVAFSIVPYLMVWGLLVVPTFLGWTAFVMAVYAAVGNRYAAYALSFALLAFTGYQALTDRLSWASNWPLWGVFRWSDLGFYETDRLALVLNRVMVLGAGAFCIALAVRLFGRRDADAVRVVHRLAPARLGKSALRLAPFAAVPAAACVALLFLVSRGLEGGVAKKADKNYWARNLKTWLDAPLPDIGRMDVRVRIDPHRHEIASAGAMTLVNGLDTTLIQVPLTGARTWRNLAWTMDGGAYEPENSERLYLFTPPRPLAPGDSVVIGWKFEGRLPGGVTKNGGNTSEFVLPSGVVLTALTPSFAPVVGYMEQVGETKDNTSEARRLRRDYWQGVTRASYGATAWFPARVTITAPAAYTLNSVGVCVRDTVESGWRTQVWQTDHPVKILNIVCGRWRVRRGEGTAVFYSQAHPYNIDEMSATLDASRKWFSEWFYPYPWRELKLSEFPGLAGYAQGFGTNITFSENIGFLTKNDAKTDATFLVTAHEAAHQWWGNILTPANGPGGDFLSEGMAHFATLLLFEQVKGPRGRMEFAKGIEARYNDRRRANEERPMYDVDGKRRNDTTIIYDRGGWVFWMIHDFLGRERAMAAHRDFFQTWSASRDHPALQDYVAAMRGYAPDPAAFDAFARQWFEDQALPQYVVEEARKSKEGEGYTVRVRVKNAGTGSMPVEVAATAGERWTKPGKDARTQPSVQDPAYREARGSILLSAGESRELVLMCAFDPEKVVVDPDVRILQLKRKQAEAKL
jgi:ABC-type transport system involved in multi-copper enzyme maturation permease subunit